MKNKILYIEIIFLLLSIILVYIIQYHLKTSGWDALYVAVGTNILLAVMSGLVVGVFFETIVRRNQRDEILELTSISKDIELSGIQEYIQEFKDFDIKKYLKNSNEIDMYLTYGTTFFSNISHVLLEIFKNNNKTINIYIISKNNPFLDSYGKFWGKNNQDYNLSGLKKRIDGTITTLTRLAESATEERQHAEINIFEIISNPVNYSFYRFDDKILFCPSKITERKEARIFALLAKKNDESDCLYNILLDELQHIKKTEGLLKTIYSSNSNN